MVEQGYEIDEAKGEELHEVAQEELKKTEYNIKFQQNLSEQYICKCNLRMYGCMHACMYACMHVCIYVCMYVCM